jgi:hypothetical protein
MQQALVVLAGDGVLRVGQVEDAGAVLEHGRRDGSRPENPPVIRLAIPGSCPDPSGALRICL